MPDSTKTMLPFATVGLSTDCAGRWMATVDYPDGEQFATVYAGTLDRLLEMAAPYMADLASELNDPKAMALRPAVGRMKEKLT